MIPDATTFAPAHLHGPQCPMSPSRDDACHHPDARPLRFFVQIAELAIEGTLDVNNGSGNVAALLGLELPLTR